VAKTGKLSSGNSFVSPSTLVTNSPPVASSVNVTGTLAVGNTLTGNYTYSDIDNDVEGMSTYQWYRNGLAISGATGITYLISSADSGKTLAFEVTPVSANGSNAASGIPVSSAGVVIGVFAIPTLSSGFTFVLLVLIGWIGFRQFKFQG